MLLSSSPHFFKPTFSKNSFMNIIRVSNGSDPGLRSPAGKGLTSWLSFVVSSVSLSLSHWYPGSGVVLDCIDS